MKPHFEVFNLVSGKVLDMYDRERDAIGALVEIASTSGVDTISRFALTLESDGDSPIVAMGDDLVRIVTSEKHSIPPAMHSTASGTP